MYSTTDEIKRFTDRLVADVTPSRRPMFVLDMDGNILIGYNPRADYAPDLGADADRRGIPADADLDALLQEGKINQGIFAGKPLDVRLPKPLVTRLNALEEAGRPFELAILTSRSEADALTILRDSGIVNPEWHTMVSDSGAVLRLQGKRQAVRTLTQDESAFLEGLRQQLPAWEQAIDAALAAEDLSPEGRPRLRLEAKGIATNIHFREILGYYSQPDDSTLAHGLTQALEPYLQEHIAEHSPQQDGAAAFTLLHGPATLEVKLSAIHKGHGLEAVMDTALAQGTRPSAVIFAGDDICNRDDEGSPSPGTDYYAFRAAPELARRTGIPIHTIHTLHPADGSLDGTEPDMSKRPMPGVEPSLTVPSPIALAGLVDATLQQSNVRARSFHRGGGPAALSR